MARVIHVQTNQARAKRAVRELDEKGTYYVHVRSTAKATKRTNKALDDLREGVNSLRKPK